MSYSGHEQQEREILQVLVDLDRSHERERAQWVELLVRIRSSYISVKPILGPKDATDD